MAWPFEALLTQTCTVHRATIAQEPAGDEVETWSVVGSFACLVQTGGGRVFVSDSGVHRSATWQLFAVGDPDVRERDRLVVDDGERYVVTFVNRLHYRGATRHVQVGLEKPFVELEAGIGR